MNIIKLNQAQLENLIYEIASSLSEFEETSEDFNVLFSKAAGNAYPLYKKKYGEEPDIDFDHEFSVLISDHFIEILKAQYETFVIEEDTDENDFVKSACFYALNGCNKQVLIREVSSIDYL